MSVQLDCRLHPGAPGAYDCSACGGSFCSRCVITLLGAVVCERCKLGRVAGLARREQRHPGVMLAFVLPIVGFATWLLIPITSSIGLVLGIRCLQEIRAMPHLSGKSLALGSIVISATTLVNWVLGLVIWIFFRPR